MFAPAIEIEVDLFQQIVARKARGQTWQEIARDVPFTVSELERLPWHFRDEWAEDAPYGEALHQQEMLARGISKIEAALFAASEPQQMIGLARALTGLLKLRQPAKTTTQHTTPSPNEFFAPSLPPKKTVTAAPREEDDEDVVEVENDGPSKTPEQIRVEEIADLLEKSEERIFNEQLEQKFAAYPELVEIVKERAKKHADRAPVLEEVQPPTNAEQTPTPPPTNKSLGMTSVAVLVFACLCGWFGSNMSETTHTVERPEPLARVQLTTTPIVQHHASTLNTSTTTIPHARPWPLSGDD
jgi:hypothetical protein